MVTNNDLQRSNCHSKFKMTRVDIFIGKYISITNSSVQLRLTAEEIILIYSTHTHF